MQLQEFFAVLPAKATSEVSTMRLDRKTSFTFVMLAVITMLANALGANDSSRSKPNVLLLLTDQMYERRKHWCLNS